MTTDATLTRSAAGPRPRPRPSSPDAVPVSELLARAAEARQAQAAQQGGSAPSIAQRPQAWAAPAVETGPKASESAARAATRPAAASALASTRLEVRPSVGGGRHSHSRTRLGASGVTGSPLDRLPTIAGLPAALVVGWVSALALLFFVLYQLNQAVNG